MEKVTFTFSWLFVSLKIQISYQNWDREGQFSFLLISSSATEFRMQLITAAQYFPTTCQKENTSQAFLSLCLLLKLTPNLTSRCPTTRRSLTSLTSTLAALLTPRSWARSSEVSGWWTLRLSLFCYVQISKYFGMVNFLDQSRCVHSESVNLLLHIFSMQTEPVWRGGWSNPKRDRCRWERRDWLRGISLDNEVGPTQVGNAANWIGTEKNFILRIWLIVPLSERLYLLCHSFVVNMGIIHFLERCRWWTTEKGDSGRLSRQSRLTAGKSKEIISSDCWW